MCTAVSWNGTHHYFGRNLDLEYDFREQICITPRRFPFSFRHTAPQYAHYAMIGTALISGNTPLYFEATNEAGLSMAGLNFPDNGVYHPVCQDKVNIASFELIPWILGQYKCVADVEDALKTLQITDTAFSTELPPTALHWILCDRDKSLVLESMADGLHIYDDPVGILTNNPPFPFHQYNLAGYRSLCPRLSENRFSPGLDLPAYSNGMGAMGLPGDFSSASRFVRSAFVKENSIGGTITQDIAQFFHILDSVAMPRGNVILPDGRCEISQYSCCCDTVSGIYYYKSYDNSRVCAVDLHATDLDSTQLSCYPMLNDADIFHQN
jgi:choloylglycine hydrolase